MISLSLTSNCPMSNKCSTATTRGHSRPFSADAGLGRCFWATEGLLCLAALLALNWGLNSAVKSGFFQLGLLSEVSPLTEFERVVHALITAALFTMSVLAGLQFVAYSRDKMPLRVSFLIPVNEITSPLVWPPFTGSPGLTWRFYCLFLKLLMD